MAILRPFLRSTQFLQCTNFGPCCSHFHFKKYWSFIVYKFWTVLKTFFWKKKFLVTFYCVKIGSLFGPIKIFYSHFHCKKIQKFFSAEFIEKKFQKIAKIVFRFFSPDQLYKICFQLLFARPSLQKSFSRFVRQTICTKIVFNFCSPEDLYKNCFQLLFARRFVHNRWFSTFVRQTICTKIVFNFCSPDDLYKIRFQLLFARQSVQNSFSNFFRQSFCTKKKNILYLKKMCTFCWKAKRYARKLYRISFQLFLANKLLQKRICFL